jgi:hypothetical protein
MNWLTKIRAALVAALLAAILAIPPTAEAQQNVQQGPINSPLGAVITNAARGASTFNSANQNNLYARGAICTFNQASHGGSPSTTFAIQMYDQASNTYQSLVTSGAITADTTPTSIIVYPGIQTATLPTGMVAFSGKLTRVWRVSETIGGTATPTVTGTVGCELLP